MVGVLLRVMIGGLVQMSSCSPRFTLWAECNN
jgi:hypothetical protein